MGLANRCSLLDCVSDSVVMRGVSDLFCFVAVVVAVVSVAAVDYVSDLVVGR